MWLFSLSRDIGIDLGTANTLVYAKGKGVVLRESSVVAIRNNASRQTLAVGSDAKQMIGRTPGNIIAIRPLKDGVIADFDVTQSMLRYFLKKVSGAGPIIKPRVVVCYPAGVTQVERNAIEEATRQAGAKEVHLLPEPMAAAIGSGLPVDEPTGSMIVDIGGGTSDVAIISLGGIVTSKSLRVAGDVMDQSIISYVRRKYKLVIGERTAEEIKMHIGSVSPDGEEKNMPITGGDFVTGLPKVLTISSAEIKEALSEPVNAIIDAIKSTLEKTPPELSADIMDRGIMLSGGGALLDGLDKLIRQETGMVVNIADEPLDCVALGAGKALENIDRLTTSSLSKKTR